AEVPPLVRALAPERAYRPHRLRPPVGDDALFWKETHVEQRHTPFEPDVFFLCLGGFFLFLLCSLCSGILVNSGSELSKTTNAWVQSWGITLSCLTMFLVDLSAAGRVSRERDRRTLEGLLTLPVERSTILFAKWWASIRGVLWLSWGLVPIWVLGLVTRGLEPFGFLLVLAANGGCVTFLATLWLWLSTVSRNNLRGMLLSRL